MAAKKLTTHENIALWQNFKAGDQGAFRWIYMSFHAVLLRYGNKIAPDGELVSDTVQDLFVNLWTRRQYLADVDNIEPYLKTSLRHELVRKITEMRSQTSFDESPELLHEFEKNEFYFQYDSDEREIALQRLEDTIAKLSPRILESLKMRYFDKMGNQEIARCMGINYQSVNNNIHRGIEMLRNKLYKQTG